MKGMENMAKDNLLEELKVKIENKKRRLNKMVTKETNKDEILKFSIELDKLILEYYRIELDKK